MLFLRLLPLFFLLIAFHVKASECPNDLSTLDRVSVPYESPWDAYERMLCLEQHFLEQDDRRVIFTSIYRIVTRNIATDIDQSEFNDRQWLTAYLVGFANLYREAIYLYELGDRSQVPETWLIAFDSAAEGSNLILQDALLGIIAHVTRDLPYALYEVGVVQQRQLKYEDHYQVNVILQDTFEEIIVMLSERYGDGIDDLVFSNAIVGALLEDVFNFALRALRDRAWHQSLWMSDHEAPLRDITQSRVESSAAWFSQLIRGVTSDPAFFQWLREVEGSTPDSEFCQRFECEG